MLADDRGWQEFAARLAQVQDEKRRHDAEMKAVLEAHGAAMHEWEQTKADALASGSVAPPQPPPPDLSGFDQLGVGFKQRSDDIRQERARYLRDNVVRFEELAADETARLLSAAQAPLAKLRKTAAQLSALLSDIRQVRQEFDRRDPNSRPSAGYGVADRTLRHVGVGELVALLEAGADPLALGPFPGQPPTRATGMDEPDPFAEQRPLGLRSERPKPFGDPDAPDVDRVNAEPRVRRPRGVRSRGRL